MVASHRNATISGIVKLDFIFQKLLFTKSRNYHTDLVHISFALVNQVGKLMAKHTLLMCIFFLLSAINYRRFRLNVFKCRMQYTVENVKCNDGEKKAVKQAMEKQKTHTLLKYLMSSCVVDSLIMQKTQKQTTRKISLNGSTLVKSSEYDDISLEMFLELVVIHLVIHPASRPHLVVFQNMHRKF